MKKSSISLPLLVCEEALDALLTRVRWYTLRGHMRVIPERLKLAFNYTCDVLGKPDEAPWGRIK